MKKILIGLFITSVISFGYNSTSNDTTDLGITIYNNNFGVVKEKRDINIDRYDNEINYKDVAQFIETDSIIIKGANILESNYEYDLVNKSKLLSRYLGEIIYIMDENKKLKYKLLSVNNGIVVENVENGEILLDPKGQIILPKLNKELQIKPAFIWKIEEDSSDDYLDVSYLTKRVNWEANYVLNLKNSRLDLIGWVNIDNRSGKTYKNVDIKLVAGDVKRELDRPEIQMLATRSKGASADQVKEQSFFDYHMYSINRKTTLKNNQSKQIKFIDTENSQFDKYYRMSNYDRKVSIMIAFENSLKNRLGIPLPKGKIKVYKEESNMTEFVGEDRIDHTPKDKRVVLDIGNAFDIEGEYRQVDYDRISTNIYEKEIEYTIKNHKKEEIKLKIEHMLSGDWDIIKSSDRYKKESNNKITFNIEVKEDETKKVNFRYRVGK